MAKGYEQEQYEKQLSEAASLLAGEVPAGKERDYLIELSRRFKPKPDYPDGTIAWVDASGLQYLAYRRNGAWQIGSGSYSSGLIERHVTKVVPLRVLGDDEIALPVVTKVTGQLRDDAEQFDGSNGYGNPSSAVLRAYADAVLRAYAEAIQAAEAEAGDQS